MKISLAIIVKDEELVIERCLSSVSMMVDEIVIVDTGSKDKTIELCRKFTDKIYNYKWENDFSKARNFSLKKCTGKWILVLDADEYIHKGSKEDLINFAVNNKNTIGKIEILSNFIEGGEESWSREYTSRFFEKGILFKGAIHEQLYSDYKRINTDISVKHTGYFKTNKSDRNIKLLEKEYKENPNNNYVTYQIAKTLFVNKKYAEANGYFKLAYENLNLKEAYYNNLIISYLYNCINISNYFEGMNIIENNNERLKEISDFNFVCGLFYMNLILSDINEYGEYLYLIENSYLKCLEIGDGDSKVLGVGSFSAAYNLGVFYETTGNMDKGNYYYKISAKYGYVKAKERLLEIKSIN